MPRAKITFQSIEQITQKYQSFNSNEDHMVSLIRFDLEIGSRTYPSMKVEIRQAYGINFDTEPIEVGRPIGANFSEWNQMAFRDACDKYYRSFFDGTSSSGRFIAGGPNITMGGNRRAKIETAEFDIPEACSGAWEL
jgi:hypothetical protein